MNLVRITSAASAHPPGRVNQKDAARHVGELSGDPRRAAAIARGTQIETRATVLPPQELSRLGTRSPKPHQTGPSPELAGGRGAGIGFVPRGAVSCVVSYFCTGYTVPGWGAQRSVSWPRLRQRPLPSGSGCAAESLR